MRINSWLQLMKSRLQHGITHRSGVRHGNSSSRRVVDVGQYSRDVEFLEDRSLLSAQVVSSIGASLNAAPSETITVPVLYRTQDDAGNGADLASDALGFNLHYDSSALTFVGVQNVLADDLLSSPADGIEGANGATTDQDGDTDRALNTIFLDFLGTFPNTPVDTSVVLYEAIFTVAEGFSGSTAINFTQNGGLSHNLTEGGDFEFVSQSLDIVVTAPAIEVSKPSVTVSETGTTATFTVTLGSQPTSNVVLNLVSSDTGEATVDKATLTFTPSNWDMPQTVTVTGVDDLLLDGNVSSIVTISVVDASSADSYDQVADKVVSVTTNDNELGLDRLESNDDQASATIIQQSQLITVLTIHSNADGSANEDFFEFTANGSGSVSIFFSHEQGDLDLKILDAAGNTVETSDSTSDNEDVSLDGLTGTFFARVYGYQSSTADYDIEFDLPAPAGPTLRVDGDTLYVDGTDGDDDLSLEVSVDGLGLVVSSQGNVITTSIAGATGAGTNSVTLPFNSLPTGGLHIATGAGDDTVSLTGDRFVSEERVSVPFGFVNLVTGEGDDTATIRGDFGSADLNTGGLGELESLLLPEEISTTGVLNLSTSGSLHLLEPITAGSVFLTTGLDVIDDDNTPITSTRDSSYIFIDAGRDIILEGAVEARGTDSTIDIHSGRNGVGGVQISGFQVYDTPDGPIEVYGSLLATGLVQIYGTDLSTTPNVTDAIVITSAGDRTRIQSGREMIIGSTSSFGGGSVSIDSRIESGANVGFGGVKIGSSGAVHFGTNADVYAPNEGVSVTVIGAVTLDEGAILTGTFGDTFVGGSSIAMADGSVIDGGQGTVTLYTSGGDIVLGNVVSQAFRINPDSPAIDILAGGNGAIVDGGDQTLDIDAPNGFVRLIGPQGIGVGNPLEIRSIEDRPILSIAALDADKPEGDSGTTPFTFEITRDGNTSGETTVRYEVTGYSYGNATPSDFGLTEYPTGEVTFLSGETTKTITINVAGDSGFESDESFYIDIDDPSGDGVVNYTGNSSGTIRNDDMALVEPPSIQVIVDGSVLRVTGSEFDDQLSLTIGQSSIVINALAAVVNTTVSGAQGTGTNSVTIPTAGLPAELIVDTGDGNDVISLSGNQYFSSVDLLTGDGNDATWLGASFPAGNLSVGSDDDPVEFISRISNGLYVSGNLQLHTAGSIRFSEPIEGGSVYLYAGVDVIDYDTSPLISTAVDGVIYVEAGRDIILNDRVGTSENLDGGNAENVDISLNADADGDGVGGVQISGLYVYDGAGYHAEGWGSLVSAGNVTIYGSDLSTTPDLADAVVLDSAGDRNRIQAGGNIQISGNFPGGVVVNGRIEQLAGTDPESPPAFPSHLVSIYGDNVHFGPDGDVISRNAASTYLTFGNGDFVIEEGAIIDGGIGEVKIFTLATGDIVLGGQITTSSSLNTAVVLSTYGQIIDASDLNSDLDIDAPNTNASLFGAAGVGVGNPLEIRSLDNTLTIAALDADKPEGNSGTTPFTFVVTRDGDISGEATIDYELLLSYDDQNGQTNYYDFDFQDTLTGSNYSDRLTFEANESTKTVTFLVGGDSFAEPDESFVVRLRNASDGVIISDSATGTIRNDDVSVPINVRIEDDVLIVEGGSADDYLYIYLDENDGGLNILNGDQNLPYNVINSTITGVEGAGTNQLFLPPEIIPSALRVDTGDGNDFVSLDGSRYLYEDRYGEFVEFPFSSVIIVTGNGTDTVDIGALPDYGPLFGDTDGYSSADIQVGLDGSVESLDLSDEILTRGRIELQSSESINVRSPIVGASVTLESGLDVIVDERDFQGVGNDRLFVSIQSTADEGTITIRAGRDIILKGQVQTTGTDSDILLIADSDHDDVGGVQLTGLHVEDTNYGVYEAYGALNATGNLNIFASDLSTTTDVADSVVLDSAGNRNRIQSGGTIFISADASIILNGRIEKTGDTGLIGINVPGSSGGDILIGSDGDIQSNGGNVTFSTTFGGIRMDNEAVIDSGTGRITLDSNADVVLGGLVSQYSGEELAIDVSSETGGIFDGGDETLDIDAPNGRFSVSAPLGVGVNNPLETRGIEDPVSVPFTPTAEQTSIVISTAPDGVVSATVSVEVPTSGYQVNWGSVFNTTSIFSAVAEFSAPQGIVLQVVETLSHTYELGRLDPGDYSFTIGTPGTGIRTEVFTVQPTSQLSIAATEAERVEGNSGSTAFTFAVTRSGDTSEAVDVTYAVAGSGDNPADAADFVGGSLPTGTVSFAEEETSKTVTIDVNGDAEVEPDENFTVTLSNATGGATISTSSATGTIREDDLPHPLLTFSYQLVDSSGLAIGANEALGPGDTFTLLVFAREDVAATPGGIGSLILDLDFDESLVETVDYSASVINTAKWSTSLTQTVVGDQGGDLFLDDLGVGSPADDFTPVGDGEDVLLASVPFRVKAEIDSQATTSASFVGQVYTSGGLTNALIVNSLNLGTVVTPAETDFGSISLMIEPFETFDLNRDGNINTADLSAMRGELLKKFADGSYVIPDRFDLNDDETINTADLSAMRGYLLSLLAGAQAARPAAPASPVSIASFIPAQNSSLETDNSSVRAEFSNPFGSADPISVLEPGASTTAELRTENVTDEMATNDEVETEVVDDAMEMAVELLLTVGTSI